MLQAYDISVGRRQKGSKADMHIPGEREVHINKLRKERIWEI